MRPTLIILIGLIIVLASSDQVDARRRRKSRSRKSKKIDPFKVEDKGGCVFPFYYNGQKYTKCTKGHEKYPWCSMTSKFNGAWKYCHDMRKTEWKCKSPCEKYHGEEYPSCKSNAMHKRMYCVDKIKFLTDSDSTLHDPKCPAKYKNRNKDHTACLNPSKYVVKTGITDQEKKDIVALHDRWRMNVVKPAAKMMKMSYDEELAVVAQHHASRCSFAHDTPEVRSIVGGKNSGQNIVRLTGSSKGGKDTIVDMFESMYQAESPRFEYGKGIKAKYKKYHKTAGHYTQLILDHVSRMGCGVAECIFADRKETLYVCNYDNMQFSHEMKKPYDLGPWCSGCKSKCVKGKLCDCGGKECLNGGKLDANTCKCACKGFWEGDSCDKPIESKKASNGCVIPYIWKHRLRYGCMKDPDGFVSYPICSSARTMKYRTFMKCKDMKNDEEGIPA